MQGSSEINHKKHTKDLTDRMKAIVKKEYLEKVCCSYQSEWEYFSKREFIAVSRRPSSVAVIWKK